MLLRARVLYPFQSENATAISIEKDEELLVFDEHPVQGWMLGENSRGERGLFPASYVEVIGAPLESEPTECVLRSAASPDFPSACHTPAQDQQSCDDTQDYWDDWDDWDDSLSVEQDGQPGNISWANGCGSQSPYNSPAVSYCAKLDSEGHSSLSVSHKSSTVAKNLNRFSSFVRSGVEAFILGDVPMMAKIAEFYTIETGRRGPQWKENPHPFTCTIEDPTKQTKFKGIKTFISYRVTPSHTGHPVYRRYKHFDWLYNRLLQKFTIICLPHLPEKQATGRFEEDFIEKRQRQLTLWMDHISSHPVLSQYEGFKHFLLCTDHRQWKLGKRLAERDTLVGAHFMLTLRIPDELQELRDVEEQVDTFKAYVRKMDDSVMQLSQVATDLAHKHVGTFCKDFQRLGSAFWSVGHAFTMDPLHGSATLNSAIAHTGRTYEIIGEMFAEQPKRDLFLMLDKLLLYQGLLANFKDMIHQQKGAFAKVKESQRMSSEGRLEQEKTDGMLKRCLTLCFVLQAEMDHFRKRRAESFREMMQTYLREQLSFYRSVVVQLENTLLMYDRL
ncbi:sorting nexin-33-like [Scleropages formosus]|uniref:Sorting nexin n=1 Tax=Scleropages formosus TaxID=113540 RepID=A0A8C9RHC1_SCLFO|nr:sorting nexin-33-like [Scleropages formosus]